ncbi:MAG: tripartite tricarboxylate transporter substrate binding protein [bacterium]|jgi:tripartite-type tricarboxylate transporter receptor subunit TctC|nr:tripartite tricarboxylate transporter substrate binding protein [Betaproteobacteria bacterium]
MPSFARAAAVGAAVAAAGATPFALAQPAAWPTKSIRFILPFPPGGGTDTLARIVGQKASEALGQPIVMDNRPGAGANIGAELAARAAPDGYTIVMGNIAHAVNMSLYRKLGYDLITDFAPVTLLASTPNILVVGPAVPAKSVAELVALAKASPGKFNYASAGSGSSSHLAGELFKTMTGIDLVHVPYKGGGPAVASLLSGEAAIGFATAPSVLPQVRAGKLRALAVTSARRSSAAPELGTIAEAGVAGYDSNTWYGVLAPRRTPDALVARLNTIFAGAMNSAEVRERVALHGFEPETSTPQAFGEYIRAEVAKWAKVVKAAGIKPE